MAWQSSDGQDHESQYDRDYYEEINLGGKNKGPDQFTNASLNLIGWLAKIAMFVPTVIAKAVGFICGLLLKLGIVGRVILTAAFVFVVLIAETMAIGYCYLSEIIPIKVLGWILYIGVIALSGAWYFLKHYHTIKEMPPDVFSREFGICGTVAFWGMFGIAAIAGLTGIISIIGDSVVLISLGAALVVWIIRTGEQPRFKLIFIIVALIAASIGLNGIRQSIDNAKTKAEHEAAIMEAAKENPGMLLALRETPFEATVTSAIQGRVNDSVIDIPAGSKITIKYFPYSDRAYITFQGQEMYVYLTDAIKPVE